MKEKLVNALGSLGIIIYYLLSLSTSILPFVMIDASFLVTLLYIAITQLVPITSIFFWIWGLVCAINGPQDIWAYIYYVTAVILAAPICLDFLLDFINKFTSKARYEGKRENSHKTISLPLVFSVLAFLLSAAALVAVLLFINSASGKDVIVSQEEAKPTIQNNIPRYDPYNVDSWTPQPAPANGQKFKDFYDAQEKVALLRINTAYAKGYYIILKPVVEDTSTYGMSYREKMDLWYRENGELHIYMRSNSTVNLLVPLGTYEVYFAKGDTWYGESYLFGPDTVYQRGKKYLEFYEESDGYSDCTIDLYSGSNSYHELYTEDIEANEFPKLVITVPD